MHLPVEVLGTDEHMLYRTTGYERVDFTGTHPVLGGYQKGMCFSCEEPCTGEPIYTDQVISRSVLDHDEIWNLILASSSCNHEKRMVEASSERAGHFPYHDLFLLQA